MSTNVSTSEDLIDFSIIETQKENIQSLPSGRSAKALASVFHPSPVTTPTSSSLQPQQQQTYSSEPTLSDTKTLNDAIRAEYEIELQGIDESDDPLDIYDRYVKWTLNAYPSAQATPQSQLLPLLERATKAFVSTVHYKNDPRYLKLWLHYIRFFADAPRETFAFLARHGIGDGLALFYEEFANWLESAGRWRQAEEVFAMGIDREARPQERLLRKFGEFRDRMERRERQQQQAEEEEEEPTSPALPTVRPALAAKIDPWATRDDHSQRGSNPQAQQRPSTGGRAGGGGSGRPGRQKLAIFSDADGSASGSQVGNPTNGWESIGSLKDRKKENTIEPKPWVGETLKVGSRAGAMGKMQIFRDESSSKQREPRDLSIGTNNHRSKPHPGQETVNPKTNKVERVFVLLEAVYPNVDDPGVEVSFEEQRAACRGWLDKDWSKERTDALDEISSNVRSRNSTQDVKSQDSTADVDLSSQLQETLVLEEISTEDTTTTSQQKQRHRDDYAGRKKKTRVREIRQETQTIKLNLESPTKRKPRRKNSSEPTMTIHTKAATDEIYDIFNQPLKSEQRDNNTGSICDSDYEDDDYTSAGESTATGRMSASTSEFGEDETGGVKSTGDEEETEAGNVSEWTEFSASKHVPKLGADDEVDSTTDTGYVARCKPSSLDQTVSSKQSSILVEEQLVTPMSAMEISPSKKKFIPIPPEDYEPPTRPFRDEAEMAQSRLPFMTPIVEKTESSIGQTEKRDYFNSKTPSATSPLIELEDEVAVADDDVTFATKEEPEIAAAKKQSPLKPKKTPARKTPPVDANALSSPFEAIVKTHTPEKSISRKASSDVVTASPTKKIKTGRHSRVGSKLLPSKGPVIKDTRCNPVDEAVRKAIFAHMQPPLARYDGYYDHGQEKSGKKHDIEKYCNAVAKMKRSVSDKTTTMSIAPALTFNGTGKTSFFVRSRLGKGAFGAVYLAEKLDPIDSTSNDEDEEAPQRPVMGKGAFDMNARTKDFEAIKMEDEPSVWEFYIIRTVHRRLGVSRAAESIVHAYEMHLFRDESFLVEEYRDQGTLIDIINVYKDDAVKGPSSTGVMDESLAMFFTIELFRTVEALHAKGILHGDLKIDNCLVRFDPIPKSTNGGELPSAYFADGKHGWSCKGLSLIDFGRGIDMKCFVPDVGFIADWETRPEDCPEMRELRPWTYQIDYYGLANIVHQMLYGKDIVTVVDRSMDLSTNNNKWYRLREPLKRYWQGDIWADVFDVLLNPQKPCILEHEDGRRLPVLKGMRNVRERMETWLERESERKGLKGFVMRLEGKLKERRGSHQKSMK